MADAPDNDVVNSFFDENNTPQAWRDLILGDETASDALRNAIMEIPNGCIPDKNRILRALTYKPPTEIKAIIVGRDPIPDARLATGLAFSFPMEPADDDARLIYNNIERRVKGDETVHLTGMSMARMKQALVNARIETLDDAGNLCYEHWAERGVLLWNSYLTYNYAPVIWLPFTERLISLVLQASIHKPVLGMFWGTPAANVVYDGVVSYVARDVAQRVVQSMHENVAQVAQGVLLNVAQREVQSMPDRVARDMRLALEGCLSYSHPTFHIQGYPEFFPAATQQFASRPELFNRN